MNNRHPFSNLHKVKCKIKVVFIARWVCPDNICTEPMGIQHDFWHTHVVGGWH